MESGEKERLAAYSSSLEKASVNLLSVRLDALRNIQPTYRIASAQMEELEVQYISITKYSQEEFMVQEWNGFADGAWQKEINVRDFIQRNYTPYEGDESFLTGASDATKELWAKVMELSEEERKRGGVLDMDTKVISQILSHGPGYLDKEKEKIVGFQTDKPFKRALQPYGGIRMAVKACEENGYHVDPDIVDFFTKHR